MWDKLRLLWEQKQREKKKQRVKAIIEAIGYIVMILLFIGWCVGLGSLII